MSAATPAEIAGLRRRYLWMATSIFVLDLAITLIFIVHVRRLGQRLAHGRRRRGAAGWRQLDDRRAGCSRRSSAISRARRPSRTIQRRLTQLPLLTAQRVGVLVLVLTSSGCRATYLFTDPGVTGVPQPTIAHVITLCVVLPVFYFTYTYFVISDYLAELCAFIFRRYGAESRPVLRQLHGQAGRRPAGDLDRAARGDHRRPVLLRRRAAASSRSGQRRVVALMGVAVSAYFVTRSLLRPIRILSARHGQGRRGRSRASACRSPPTTRSASSPASSTPWSRACASASASARPSAAMSTRAWPPPSCAARARACWPARSARPPSCSPTSRASPPSPSTWRPTSWWRR